MKHPKKSFVSLVLAVAMVITCFLSFGGVTAAAIVPEYDQHEIYYFYDCYPTAPKELISDINPEYSICYDGQAVSEDEFYSMINDRYFSGFEPGTIVIIDIKLFKPDLDHLAFLVECLKEEEYCATGLVTCHTAEEIEEADMGMYLDMHFEAELVQLEDFVDGALSLQASSTNTLQGTCFLIDSNMVEITYPNQVNMYSLLDTSPFLRLLWMGLCGTLLNHSYEFGDNISYDTYSNDTGALYNVYNVRLLVHIGNGQYMDVFMGQIYSASTVQQLQSQLPSSTTRFCAFGFWSLTGNFYNFLSAGQQSLGAGNLPVYVYEIDPIVPGPGLIINTPTSGEGTDEIERFIEALTYLLEVASTLW